MLFYRIVRPIVTGVPRLLWRVRVVGMEHVPKSGGFILAPSHRSMMDIPLAALVTTAADPVHGQGRRCSRCPVLGHALRRGWAGSRSNGTAPTARRCATRWRCSRRARCSASTRRARARTGRKIQPLQPGAAYFALRSGVPIIPIGIAGTEEILREKSDPFPRFGRVTIVVGPPLVTDGAQRAELVPRGAQVERDSRRRLVRDALRKPLSRRRVTSLRDGSDR